MTNSDTKCDSKTGVLYIVPTPIGNLQDITERALNVLRSVATIAAEDTRRCRKLLRLLDIRTPQIIALHEHNEATVVAAVLQRLEAGADVALVSDAGTPLLCDPGHLLLRALWQRGGIRVVPLPGASALTTLLSACPLPLSGFAFDGFLPAKAQARRRRLQQLLGASQAVVFFEVPHRIEAALAEIDQLAPDRRLFIGRELTKLHESLMLGCAAELMAQLRTTHAVRGEFVVVLEGQVQVETAADRVISILVQELAPAQAARLAARITGQKKSELYAAACGIKERDPSG